MDPIAQLHQLFSEDWEARLRADPLAATAFGDHRYDDRLPDATEETYQGIQSLQQSLLDRLHMLDTASLPPTERTNAAIFATVLANEIGRREFRDYRMPVTRLNSFYAAFLDLPQISVFSAVADYENYTARLRAFRQYAAENIALIRAGIREGMVMPRVVLADIEKTLQPHLVSDPTASILYEPLKRFPAAISQSERERLSFAAQDAIQESLVPGLRDTLDFLVNEYLPAARQSISAADLPGGAAYYRALIRYHTNLDLSPEEIHAIGKAEVERIRAEMQALIQQVGFQGDFHAFVHLLRTDPRFYVDTPLALLKEISLVLKRMDGELPGLFKTLPRTPYGIRAVPAHMAPGTTTAYYFPPTGDGLHAGNYYVNTYDLKSRPLYEIEALSLHEAVPGHHLQIALQQELGEVPNFRRFMVGGFTAFIEGWALYAERLGLECGFYTDPYSNFGRLSYEIWRACRLVVDTGMHALGWTRQQAIDYMLANSALTALNVTNEVDRYIGDPAQALAYKLGELKIRDLRARAERDLGSRFDLRLFHDAILSSGAIPLDLLERNVDEWIKSFTTESTEFTEKNGRKQ